MQIRHIAIIALAGIVLAACTGTTDKSGGDTADRKTTELQTPKTTETMKPIAITKADFLTKVANYEQNPDTWQYLGDKPCLVDFYASWCGPCKMLAPILDELAAEYADSIYIYKVDTEAEQELAAAFGIRSIPTLLFVPMTGQPQITQGALPKHELRKAIDTVLLNK